MRLLRFFAIVIYASYLLNVGLLLLMVPWSEAWGFLILRLPPPVAMVLGEPAVRGLISAFGLLHLIMVVVELVFPLRSSSS